MILLWDASAPTKRYVPEPGSPTVNALFKSPSPNTWLIPDLTYLEVLRVIVRQHNRGDFDLPAYATAMAAIRFEVFESPRFGFLSLSPAEVFAGADLIVRHNLNSTDAAILALFLRSAREFPPGEPAILLASDARLIRAAESEGLLTLNPEMIMPDDWDSVLTR